MRNYVREMDNAHQVWKKASQELDIDGELVLKNALGFLLYQENIVAILNFLQVCEYHQFLSLCEVLYDFLERDEPKEAQDFLNAFNNRCVRYYLAYRMDDEGRVVEPGTRPTEEAIEEARAILRSSALRGPDRQFQDALLDCRRVPNPNYEGSVASAANAIEGVSRCVLEDSSVKLGPALARMETQGKLPPALRSAIGAVWGYASDEGGRHGLVGDPKVDRLIAEFCLHNAAASIILIARLYGHEVVEQG